MVQYLGKRVSILVHRGAQLGKKCPESKRQYPEKYMAPTVPQECQCSNLRSTTQHVNNFTGALLQCLADTRQRLDIVDPACIYYAAKHFS